MPRLRPRRHERRRSRSRLARPETGSKKGKAGTARVPLVRSPLVSRPGPALEIASHSRTLVFDQTCLVRKVQKGAAVPAQPPVFGRRATRFAEPVAHLVLSLLCHGAPRQGGQ